MRHTVHSKHNLYIHVYIQHIKLWYTKTDKHILLEVTCGPENVDESVCG